MRLQHANPATAKRLGTLALLLMLSAAPVFAQDAGPLGILSITGGQVQGVPTDVDGVTVLKGIPYAGPQGGDNRFAAPTPVVPWDGVKIADTWPDRSMHWSGINPVGEFYGDEFYYDEAWIPPLSEDGASLNIFTPANSSGEALPVYFWIHGGANAHGYASEIEFWASKLAEKGIVVVLAQYRLGPFGELALQEIQDENPQGVAGNQRLQDLIAALNWTKENIAAFGGDPETVTIGGQSAGSRNVYSLLRSPLAKGLFDRAVMQSAFRIGPAGEAPATELHAETPTKLEELFGKPMTLADLRAVPAERFFEPVGANDDTLLYYALRSALNGDAIDGVSITEESVDLMREGNLDGIDFLVGAVADEGTASGDPEGTMALDEYAKVMEEKFGPDWESAYPAGDPEQAYRLTRRTNGDYAFAQALLSAQYAANNNEDVNAYAYYFDNPPPGRNSEYYGSWHSSDLWYFFNSMRTEEGQRPWTEADFRLAETISSYLANFVKTGDPNGEGLPTWPTADNGEFVRFADGYAYPVDTTPYPSRDKLNQQVVMEEWDISEENLGR